MLPKAIPPQYESRLTLKNGREVLLRPVMRTDGHLLVDLFNRMSPQSRYLRFMTNLHALSEEMLYHFTHVDYEKEFALVGAIREDGNDAIIAVGRYARDPDEDLADLAVAVRDDWQHLGLGKSLLVKIVDIAREHGICRFKRLMDPRNDVMKHILRELGFEVKYFLQNGVCLLEIRI